jgi:hypothetical protein
VDEVARTVRHARKKALRKRSRSPDTDRPGLIIKSSKVTNSSSNTPSNIDLVPLSTLSTSTTAVLSNLNLSAFYDNIYISFVLANLFAGAAVWDPWMRVHAEDTSSIAQVSIRALGAAYFGKMHRQHDIVERGSVQMALH